MQTVLTLLKNEHRAPDHQFGPMVIGLDPLAARVKGLAEEELHNPSGTRLNRSQSGEEYEEN